MQKQLSRIQIEELNDAERAGLRALLAEVDAWDAELRRQGLDRAALRALGTRYLKRRERRAALKEAAVEIAQERKRLELEEATDSAEIARIGRLWQATGYTLASAFRAFGVEDPNDSVRSWFNRTINGALATPSTETTSTEKEVPRCGTRHQHSEQ